MGSTNPPPAELVAALENLRHRVTELEAAEWQRHRAVDALRFVIDATSTATGEEFFPSLARHLAAALHVRFAFVAELVDDQATRARLITFWNHEDYGHNFEYDVSGTPCAHVVGRQLTYFASELAKLFPQAPWTRQFGAESYLAVPFFDSMGRPLGHMGVMHDGPMDEGLEGQAILRILAGRAAAELERKRTADALQERARQQRRFTEALAALLNIVNQLATAESRDELCRLAVGLGRDRLGFDRLGIWFLDQDRKTALGSFGTDEQGRTRDERGQRVPLDIETQERLLEESSFPVLVVEHQKLRNHRVEMVGTGTSASAPMWDGQRIIGFLYTDNLLRGQPFAEHDREILGLYGSAVGHLCSRKRVEEALRESERRVRQVVESLPIVLSSAEAHTNRRLLLVGAVKKVFGYDPEPFLADPNFGASIIHPDDRERVAGVFRDGLASMRPFELELRIVHGGDGHPAWLRHHVVPVPREDGTLLRHDSVISDITQRKQAEESLRQSEARFRMLSENALVGVYIIQDGKLRYVNPALAEMFRYRPEEMIDRVGPTDLTHPDDRALVAEQIRRRIEGEVEVAHYTWRGLRTDGQIIECESIGRRLEYQGRPAIIGTVLDITERRRTEAALRESEERFRTFFDELGDAAYRADAHGSITYVNKFSEQLTGRPVQELIGKPFLPLFAPESQPTAVDAHRRTLAGESPEYELTFTSGRTCQFKNQPLRDRDGNVVGLCGIARDVTGRKQAERRLRLLSAAVEQSSEGIAVADLEGNLLFVNDAFAQMHGYRPEEVVGRHLSVFHTPEQMPAVEQANRQVRETGAFGGEVWHAHREGSPFVALMHNTLVRDEEGHAIAMIGTVRDITERKRMEEALRSSEYQYRTTLDAMGDAIHVADRDLRLLLANRSLREWADRLGLQTEMVGRHILDVFPFLPATVPDEYRHVFDTGKVLVTEEEVVIDEQKIVTETRKIPIFEGPQVTRVVTVIRDVTDRKQAEQDLRESEELYRTLVETSPDGIMLSDLDANILMANQRAVELHGLAKPDDMIGRSGFEFVSLGDQQSARESHRILMERGSVRGVEYTVRRQDGSLLFVETSASVVLDAQGGPKALIVVNRDVTARNRLQQQLLQSQKLESIGTLAGGIAHDFNNLLAVIVGNASILQRQEELSPRTRDLLGDIMHAAERGSALTHQLLAYARGGLHKPVPTDLNRVVRSVLQLLERTAPPQIGFGPDLPKGLPLVVGDPSQLEQVVMNLCLNAIQACEPPSVIQISIRREVLDRDAATTLDLAGGAYLRLQVQDQGCGMDAETLERAFEPFFTTKPMGRGMGLAAAQGIVHSHHGQIRIQSTPKAGTTVAVWLPTAETSVETAAPPAMPERAEPPHGCETILVIDDDQAVTRVMEQSLTSLGYCPVAHNDAGRALAFLDTNAEDIDLVLLNLHLPDRSADQMLTEIRRRCPQVPVLLTSGLDARDTVEALTDRGAAGFVQKPFSLMTLATAVRTALDNAPKTR